MSPIVPVLSDPTTLIGRWRLDRTIDDRLSGRRGCVHGSLTISDPDQTGGLDWIESGTMTWDGNAVEASRRLRLVIHDRGWWVTFADGGLFHPWQPGSWVEHPCSRDLYRGLVSANRPDRVRIVWQVSGPAKDHTITSRLRRP